MKAVQPYARKLITFFKVLLFPVTLGFIGYKLLYAYKINDLFEDSGFRLTFFSCTILLIVVALMCVNWLLETKKWQLLISKQEPATYFDALKAVLSGVTLNIITPNQLGDFIGRLIYLKQTDKIKGTLLTVIGHTAQVMMTLAFGIWGLLYFSRHTALITSLHYTWLCYSLFVLTGVSILCYFNMRVIGRLKVAAKYSNYLETFSQYTRSELFVVLLISLARYLVFLIQYYLLTRLFMVNVEVEQALAAIMAAICAQSFVPSFLLTELGMRGASALWFFSAFTPQVAPVLLTTYALWMINAMLPGLAGLVFILRWRLANK